MQSRAGAERAILFLAFAAGATLVAMTLAAGRVGGRGETGGARVEMTAWSTGELSVRPTGLIAVAAALEPGPGMAAEIVARNQTGRRLSVRVRARLPERELDRVARFRVQAAGRDVAGGPLRRIRRWSTPFTLASGALARIRIRVWLPSVAPEDYAGRFVTVPLELDSTPEES